METNNLANRTLEIDGMTGDACIQKVTGVLKNVAGVSTQSVKVGAAHIGADQAGCNAARAALGVAGFKSREGLRAADSTDAGNPAKSAAPAIAAPAGPAATAAAVAAKSAAHPVPAKA